MPPPQAPPATGPNAGRTPASPQAAAPPTPQQANKAAPKKKDTKDTRKVCFLPARHCFPFYSLFCYPLVSFFFFFIEHFLSAQQRNRPLPLRTPTRRLLHRRKRSIPQRPHPQRRLLLSTPTRSIKMEPTQQLALHSNRHLHQRLSLWCRSNSRSRLNRHSSSNRRRHRTRTSRLVISILLRMYVSFYIASKKNIIPLTWFNSHLLSISTLAHWKTQIYSKTSILTRSLIPMQTRPALGLIQTYPMPQTVSRQVPEIACERVRR